MYFIGWRWWEAVGGSREVRLWPAPAAGRSPSMRDGSGRHEAATLGGQHPAGRQALRVSVAELSFVSLLQRTCVSRPLLSCACGQAPIHRLPNARPLRSQEETAAYETTLRAVTGQNTTRHLLLPPAPPTANSTHSPPSTPPLTNPPAAAPATNSGLRGRRSHRRVPSPGRRRRASRCRRRTPLGRHWCVDLAVNLIEERQ